jgi:ATP-dependent RNA helicase RhlE
MELEQEQGFEKFKLNKKLEKAIHDQNWSVPTQIQEKAIPLAKAGKDILGIAQTGTGKTAAFLLPLMAKLHFPQGMHTRAIVLAPTKELVMQLSIHFQALNSDLNFRYVVLVGGIGISKQLADLKAGNDIVFATPGRFLEIYETNEWKVKEIKTLVIDEADRMLDMGFMPQIRSILEKIPSKRQNLLFSATFSPTVEELASEFLEFPVRVEASEQSTVATTIDQSIIRTLNFQTKLNTLLDILRIFQMKNRPLFL